MTVGVSQSRVSYTGNGVTTSFSFPHRFFADGDLTVYLVDATGAIVTGNPQVLDTDYTVTGANNDAGGSVAFVAAPTSGYKVVIINDPPIEQTTDYVNSDAFPAASHEDALDRLTKIIQRVRDLLDRCVKVSDVSEAAPPDPQTILDAAATATTKASEASASATLASQWASLTTGLVATLDYSAKAWAVGGTGVTNTSGKGAAKEWATTTGATVDTSDYSSKEWAVGVATRGVAGKGSAKDWADYTAGSVDGVGFSAKYWSDQAAGYAASMSNPWVFISDWDATTGAFPGGGTAQKGWVYVVTVEGTVNGELFTVGDELIAKANNASTTTFAGNWVRVQGGVTSGEVISALGFTPVPNTRTVGVSGGLLSGGGALSANVTVTLTPATTAELLALTANKAVDTTGIKNAMAYVGLGNVLGNVTPDLTVARNIRMTLTGNAVLKFPSVALTDVVGLSGIIEVVEDATGGFTLSFDVPGATGYIFDGGTPLSIDTVAGRKTKIGYHIGTAAFVELYLIGRGVR